MRLLLDTHTLLWWLDNSPKLSKMARQAMGEPESELLVSVASLWEIVIKHQLGKLEFPTPLEQTIPEMLSHYQIRVLPIEIAHLVRFHQLPLLHRDLFDRILIAQAFAESLTLVTKDVEISAYGVSTLF